MTNDYLSLRMKAVLYTTFGTCHEESVCPYRLVQLFEAKLIRGDLQLLRGTNNGVAKHAIPGRFFLVGPLNTKGNC